jgi:hypothetical protein
MKCRCPSESHGHRPGKCKNLATEANQMCKQCYDKTVKEIHDPRLSNKNRNQETMRR